MSYSNYDKDYKKLKHCDESRLSTGAHIHRNLSLSINQLEQFQVNYKIRFMNFSMIMNKKKNEPHYDYK